MKTLTVPLDVAKPRPSLNFAQRPQLRAAMVPSPLRIGKWKWPLLAALLLAPGFLFAQQYSIDWYKVAGGGGTSTGGVYSVSGTIGQPDASGAMTGGNYSLTGGFWALYAVQTPGAPLLTITYAGNQAIVSWSPSVTGWTLQTNANLASPTWGNYLGTVVNNSVTNTPPTGNLFFRLSNP
jgi:hypothetical protein